LNSACRPPSPPKTSHPSFRAFYILTNISKTGHSSTEFAEKLLEKERVAVVPGKAFGDDQTVRLSYATSIEQIEEGARRLAKFCK